MYVCIYKALDTSVLRDGHTFVWFLGVLRSLPAIKSKICNEMCQIWF